MSLETYTRVLMDASPEFPIHFLNIYSCFIRRGEDECLHGGFLYSGDTHKAGQGIRNLHPGKAFPMLRDVHDYRQIQAQIGHMGKRMRGIKGERRQLGKNVLLKDLPAQARWADCKALNLPFPLRARWSPGSCGWRPIVGRMPSGGACRTPALTAERKPATRIIKNSSRFFVKIAKNLTRSSSG